MGMTMTTIASPTNSIHCLADSQSSIHSHPHYPRHHISQQSPIETLTTMNRYPPSRGIEIKKPCNPTAQSDGLPFEDVPISRSSIAMYDSATWRMYHRIMSARRRRTALRAANNMPSGFRGGRSCEKIVPLVADPGKASQGGRDLPHGTGDLKSTPTKRGSFENRRRSDSRSSLCEGMFSLDI